MFRIIIITVILLYAQISLAVTATVWPPEVVVGPNYGSGGQYELGVKFRADVAGYITAIRFYKYSGNTGTHIGNLWTTGGTNLGSVIFTNETASGWQQATFATPIPVTTSTTYIASYHTTTGYFAYSLGFFVSAGTDSPPLHLLQNGVDGGNGVFLASAATGFPSQVSGGSNYYWVDIVLEYTLPVTGWTMIMSDYSNEINFAALAGKVISWDPPTTNTDASVLLDLGGYVLECGPSSRNYTLSKTFVGNITQYDTTGWLTPNIFYYCAVKAYNTGIPSTMRIWRNNNANIMGSDSTDNFMQ